MIIDTEGNEIVAFLRTNGIVIQDKPSDNPYNVFFSICVEYTEEQKRQHKQIQMYKDLLAATDYQAIKFSDGAISEEEYAPIRTQRADWRAQINKIQEDFHEPTLTREEMDAIEYKAMHKLKEQEEAANGNTEQ